MEPPVAELEDDVPTGIEPRPSVGQAVNSTAEPTVLMIKKQSLSTKAAKEGGKAKRNEPD